MRVPKVHYNQDLSDQHRNSAPGPAREANSAVALSKIRREEWKDKKMYESAQVTLKPSEYVDDVSMFEDDPKELHKFVVRTKFLIRGSWEYTQLMSFLKKYRGMYCCGVHNNVKKWDGFDISIHHLGLTIEDIIYIVINKRLKRGEDLKQSSIGKEVMFDHYIGLVSLYPLCDICHSYIHGDSNDLFIPFDVAFGDPEAFFEIYDEYIPEALKSKFRNIVEMTKGYNIIKNEIPDELRKHLIYIDSDAQIPGVSQTKLYDLITNLSKPD